MSKTKTILNTVLGAPNSLTAIAFQTGELMERERIIKLLTPIHRHEHDEDGEHTKLICITCQNIALIKGENTDKATVHTSADNTITKTHCDDCNDWGCHGCSCDDVEDYCGTCGKGENK